MKFLLITLTLFTLSRINCSAQSVFNKRFSFGTSKLEVSGNLLISNDTIYTLCSTTTVGGNWEMLYQKTDLDGNQVGLGQLSVATTDVTTQEVSKAILDMGDSIIHLALFTVDGMYSETMVECVHKTTLDTLWTKRIGDGTLYNFVLSELYSVEDSLVLIGETDILDMSPGTSVDLVILKCDLQFNIGWQKIIGGGNRELHFGSVECSDKGFLITGITKSNTFDGEYDGVAYKVDSLGNLEWTFQDKNLYPDYPVFFVEVGDGYLGTGFNVDSAYDIGGGYYNYFGQPFSIKLDFNGDEVWRKYYSPPHGKGNMYGVLQFRKTLDGNFAILGMHGHGGADSEIPYRGRGYLMKINENGDSLWYREYKNLQNENTYNYIRDVAVHPDGGYVMTGFLWPAGAPDTGYQDMWLVKTNCLGFDHEPVAEANWFADDNYRVILDNNSRYFGNCIINWGDGTSNYIYEGYDTLITHDYDDNTPYQIEVIAFACDSYDTVFVDVFPQQLSVEKFDVNQLVYLAPNPTSDVARIFVTGDSNQITKLTVFDIQGNIIDITNITFTDNQYYIETGHLANGIYLVHVTLDSGMIQVLKLNVVR